VSAQFDQKLEKISTMLETARAIVEALEIGETVEEESDADHAIEEARRLAKELLPKPKG
jgi:hypothetical protein